MTTRAQKLRLGIFLLLAAILFVGFAATLLGLALFADYDRFTVRFRTSVAGLEVGAPVRLKGVRVGQVVELAIDTENIEVAVATLELRKRTPIKEDTIAVVQSVGITGLKFVELVGGTTRSARLSRGSEITAGESAVDELTGRATDIALKAEALINQLLSITAADNRARLERLLDSAAGATDSADIFFTDATLELKTIDKRLGRLEAELKTAVDELRVAIRAFTPAANAVASFAEEAKKPARSFTHTADEITKAGKEAGAAMRALRGRLEGAEFDRALDSIAAAGDSLRDVSARLDTLVRGTKSDVHEILRAVRAAAEDLRLFSRSIREDPSRLLRPGREGR